MRTKAHVRDAFDLPRKKNENGRNVNEFVVVQWWKWGTQNQLNEYDLNASAEIGLINIYIRRMYVIHPEIENIGMREYADNKKTDISSDHITYVAYIP